MTHDLLYQYFIWFIEWISIYSSSRKQGSDLFVHQIPQKSIVKKKIVLLNFCLLRKIWNQKWFRSYKLLVATIQKNTDYDKNICFLPKIYLKSYMYFVRNRKRQFIVRESTASAFIFYTSNSYSIKRMKEI